MKKLLFLLILIVNGNLKASTPDPIGVGIGVACSLVGTAAGIWSVKLLKERWANYKESTKLQKEMIDKGAQFSHTVKVWGSSEEHITTMEYPKNCSPETCADLNASWYKLTDVWRDSKFKEWALSWTISSSGVFLFLGSTILYGQFFPVSR